MRITIKKCISLLLSLMIVLSMFVSIPTTIIAATAQTGTTGRCKWTFDEATSTLTISGNGSMGTYNYDNGYYPPWFEKFSPKIVIVEDGVTNISKSAFEGCGTITSISLGNTITSIGNYAFRCCSSLTNISIPESVTTIGEEAFNSCTKLQSVIIPDGVTSLGKSAFRYCHALTSATISKSLTKINDLTFAECENLTQIVIPDGVKTIGQWAFASDSHLENVTLPNSLTSIGNAAFNCAGLTSVVVPDSIKKLDSEGVFAACENLKSVTLPEGLKIIGDSTFANCESLTEINIPSSVTELGQYAFSWCTSLKELILPNKLVSIGENAFWYCVCLSEVSLPKSVTSIGDGAFMDCTSLKSITIPPAVTSIGRYAVGYYADPSIKPIDGFTVFGKAGSTAEQYATDNNLNFERQTSGITGDCTWNLSGTVLTISGNGSTEYFASSSEAPWDSSITQIIIEEGVTSIQGGAFFKDLPNLESVFMPDSITFLYDGLFSERENAVVFYCSSESKAAMYALTHSGVTAKYIRGTSGDCTWSLDGTVLTVSGNGAMANYQSHYVPWGREITEVILKNGVTSIGNYAFYECKSLEKISIPESVTRIGNCAMEYCTGLQKIYIPSSVTIIAAGAFEYCESLSLVEGLEGLTEWYQYCFADCKSLTDFVIPENITSIPYSTFSNCSNLHNIYIPTCVNTIENSAFNNIDNLIVYAVRGSFAQQYSENNTQILFREYAGDCSNCGSSFSYYIYEEPTCTQNGAIITNCAKCEFKHTEIISATGHHYSKTIIAPTCTEKGYSTYTCDACGHSYVSDEVDAIGHDWAEGKITFSADGKSATATRICNNDSSHIETVNCTVTSSVTKAATCTEKGQTTYTAVAVFSDGARVSGTKTVTDINAIGHDWAEGTITFSADGKKATATRICNNDPSHNETVNCTVTSVVTKAATCTAKGQTTYTAKGVFSTGDQVIDTKVVSDINALGHDWETGIITFSPDGKTANAFRVCKRDHDHTETVACLVTNEVETPATCTEDGKTKYSALAVFSDGTELSDSLILTDIKATGHHYESSVTPPTCTERGYTTHTCSVCGHSYKDTFVKALGHDWDEGKVTKEPTCTEQGVKTYTCKHDSNHTYTEPIKALGHSYESVVTPPTCTEKGYTTHTCSRCSDSYVDSYVKALGHDWDEGKVTKEPTCTEKGVRTYTCKHNNTHTYTEPINALGHNYESVVTPPTCTEKGYTTHTCSRCNDSYVDSYVNANGHSWNEGVITTEPDCTHNGVKTFTCSECGETREEVVESPGHQWDEGTVTKEPTYHETGEMTYTCTVCKATRTEILPCLEKRGKFVISDETVRAGDEVKVKIYIDKNPGITGLSIDVDYPEALTLTDIKYTDLFSAKPTNSKDYNSPMTISWHSPGSLDEDATGLFATLTFVADINAEATDYTVRVTYKADNIIDSTLDDIPFDVENGTVSVQRPTPGDVNRDGAINMKDIVLVQQYINHWDVSIVERAADVNDDGDINMKDLVILQQYINGWEVELK